MVTVIIENADITGDFKVEIPLIFFLYLYIGKAKKYLIHSCSFYLFKYELNFGIHVRNKGK